MNSGEYYGEEKQLMIWIIPRYHLTVVEVTLWHKQVLQPVDIGFLRVWLLIEAAEWIVQCTGLWAQLRFRQMLQNWSDRTLIQGFQAPATHLEMSSRIIFISNRVTQTSNVMQWTGQSFRFWPLWIHLLVLTSCRSSFSFSYILYLYHFCVYLCFCVHVMNFNLQENSLWSRTV